MQILSELSSFWIETHPIGRWEKLYAQPSALFIPKSGSLLTPVFNTLTWVFLMQFLSTLPKTAMVITQEWTQPARTAGAWRATACMGTLLKCGCCWTEGFHPVAGSIRTLGVDMC